MFKNIMANKLNMKKLAKLVKVMYDNPDGLWIRQMARVSGLPVSTVHHYLQMLSPLTEETQLGERPLMRVVRFRPEIMKKLDQGMSVNELVRIIRILKSV